jgi:hypothetical protein
VARPGHPAREPAAREGDDLVRLARHRHVQLREQRDHVRPDQRQHRQFRGRVARLDLRPEPHRVQVLQQRLGGAGLHVEVHGAVDVRDDRVVLDPALDVQDQRLGAPALGQRGEVLAGQRVQPAEPVVAGHGEHAAVRAVDHGDGARRRPLLGERVAEVPRHALVGGAVERCDGTRCGEQR